jgi:glycosyltransferase involved in cell wall biosynthesis
MSIDGTLQVVEGFADNVIVEDANIARGRNILINFVLDNFDSEFLVFVNSDVILPKDWLQSAVDIIEKIENCGALGSFQKKPQGLQEKVVYHILDVPNSENFSGLIVKHHNVPCEAAIYRISALRSLHEKYGYCFNEKLRAGEDPELSQRLIKAGWQVCLSKHLVIDHKMKSGLKSFWKQQILYGKGLKDFAKVGFTFESSRRLKQLMRAPISYGYRERNTALFFVMYFYLAIKILANVLGRYS